MKTLKSSVLTLLCLTRIMSTFGPNNLGDHGRSWVVIDSCFETCEHLVYMSSTKEPRGFYPSRVAKNPEIFHLKQRILLNNSSHFTGSSTSKHIIVTHENKVFHLGPVPQKMVKLTQNLEPNFKHGFLV